MDERVDAIDEWQVFYAVVAAVFAVGASITITTAVARDPAGQTRQLVHGLSNAAWAFGPGTRAQSVTFCVLCGLLGVAIAMATRGRLGFGRDGGRQTSHPSALGDHAPGSDEGGSRGPSQQPAS